MDTLLKALSSAEIDTVRDALRATVEGTFFPDWEFETLIGVDRATVREVHAAWPRRTVDQIEFTCAVINSMNNLVGYPHGRNNELVSYVSGGRAAVEKTLARLIALRF
ncbi:hypothetical protein CI1B_07900 [Bradyrhizobium ivorense]|uniref:Uncharacterized protein n=1 Tax=Bradyrhizobium ivorense TaxID=2511166 RepID=A0A508STC9_9BRAD|nr:hypothetical protein [Bradyrhizobium ivorense]VIO65683.1 hypothetical protein CI1B_07900 [Bradyrhizobium ivorense]